MHFDIARFRAAAGRWAEAGARLRNPAPVLMWNCDKRYLEVLAAHGAPVIPTLFVDRLSPADLTRAADAFGAEALEPDGFRSNRSKPIRLHTFDSKARFSDQAIPPDPIVL